MGEASRPRVLGRAVAWFRRALAPPTHPLVEQERSRTLLSRARAACWLALGIIPFTIVIYNAAFFPDRLAAGAVAAAGADLAIVMLLIGIRRGVFDRHPSIPFALLTALICNLTEGVNLILTGGVDSDFIFPYYVVLFGLAIFYPAPLAAVVTTAALFPLGYVGVALATSGSIHDSHFVSSFVLLVDVAVITSIGNVVVTNLFLREVRLRIDLEGANDRLRELDRLKSEFFANVSHELRTPLTLILAPVASLVSESKGKLLPGQRYLAETVQRNATRLLQLINDLLLLAKLEAGEPEIDRVPVDVEATVRRIVDEAIPYAKSLDLYLVIEVAPGSYIWNGDERHLQRIALNLVSNACKFSRPGGVVRVELGNDADGIRLRVVDQGIGIAPKDLHKIFERFVQVESSAIRRFEGTGIGLSIVKQLVMLHGGSIVAQSEPGQGSTFEVHLPLMRALATGEIPAPPSDPGLMRLQPAGVAPPPMPELRTGPRVMVVEDNPELLTYLVQELGRWYRITPCSESPAALRDAIAAPPDLIVSDIMMPDMDGIALARNVRAAESTREVPVVLVSAREEVEAKLAGFEAGADDYVQKPFQMQELHARIELHLRLRAQARDLRATLERLKQAESSLVQSEKMVALGRMVAGVAHEMNNPLHFLHGNLELLRARIPQQPALEPLFRDIDESLERMTSVTRQLLLFGRKHEGEGAATVKLAEVVPLVLKMVAPQVPKGVRIVQGIDGEQVRASPQDLFQIVLNLVHNAIQAVDPESGEVRVESSRVGDRVELRVADNGCGISREDLPRIFDPFFTTKPPGSGTGLGLSIVQELVHAQQGTVGVESEQGRGTTISVSLRSALP